MAKYQKSAKDKAFDEERAKFNKKIRELEYQVKTKELEIRSLKESHEKENAELEELRDWNRRLLEYMDLSEDEMRSIISKEKEEGAFWSVLFEIAKIRGVYR